MVVDATTKVLIVPAQPCKATLLAPCQGKTGSVSFWKALEKNSPNSSNVTAQRELTQNSAAWETSFSKVSDSVSPLCIVEFPSQSQCVLDKGGTTGLIVKGGLSAAVALDPVESSVGLGGTVLLSAHVNRSSY